MAEDGGAVRDEGRGRAQGAAAASAVLDVIDGMARRLERPPSAAEFAEVLSQSLPIEDDRIDVEFEAPRLALRGKSGLLRGDVEDVYDLPDYLFDEASNLFEVLLDSVNKAAGIAESDICESLTDLIRSIPGDRLTGYSSDMRFVMVGPPAKHRPQIGDVVAVPVGAGAYRLAVLIAKNRFGVAFGFFRGRFAEPRMPRSGEDVHPFPLYADDRSVRNGKWPLVGHSSRLVNLFPAEPEIYHKVGLAENAAGSTREISDEEAAQVKLSHPRFRQIHVSDYLADFLDSELLP
ncbi:hypothetical protein AMIS_25990 [Actinoplanes missouriensis 431]|uniref:Uncharacterized protein n=2 Tax=Actinoplanes missouriensis TaxID=1866 RepID=I0H482_ACTM4|nr:hypothetical protein AMIS_25990 [Actinoplanes missouriensis 431]